ncbi:Lrp/AsnC ligand binding domain-containing protein [Amycolatopsis panacis]|uniref:Transcription regulator AsnC/Lrp ligand binding domain-containing protein n=1 Tax=Amycolatopsis panacis TaxID=2340917 RepID=A0A419HNS7_9PSEU|nr:Lrp/AsnC ligand binding domain-containing protein [Amycolatopsis panacis]RJQ77853.1 hypothetical protein D5S19_28620 [Amycolatopsis panacis]
MPTGRHSPSRASRALCRSRASMANGASRSVHDYYLRVLVADHEEYEALTLTRLSRLPALSRISSHQTMRLVKG